MDVITINPQTNEVTKKDMQLQANSIYSFFNSILIDDVVTLKNHIIHTDAEALCQNKKPYMLGSQLLVGDALIIGQNGLEECDVTITEDEVKELLNYDLPQFYLDVLEVLSKTDVNLYKTFEVEKNSEKIALNTEWVLYTFNIADEKTKEYFLTELKKSEEKFVIIQKMAQLAMNVAG